MRIIKTTLLCCFILIASIQDLYAAFCPQCGERTTANANFCTVCGTKLSNSPLQQPDRNAALKGTAYINFGEDNSNVLSGITLHLIPKSKKFQTALGKIQTIGKNLQAQINLTKQNFYSQVTPLATDDIEKFYAIFAVSCGYTLKHINKCHYFFTGSATSSTKTDPDGTFTINPIPAGKYYLYAKYKTESDDGYWLIPIEIKPGPAVEITLGKENFNNEQQYLLLPEILALKQYLEEAMFIATSYNKSALARMRATWNELVLKFSNAAKPQYPGPITY